MLQQSFIFTLTNPLQDKMLDKLAGCNFRQPNEFLHFFGIMVISTDL